MPNKYSELYFSNSVCSMQREKGSRDLYNRLKGKADHNQKMSPLEAAFIAERDSFYIASINENGWPYLQHRGGPKGFVKVIDEATLGFSDYRGNLQYITAGNVRLNNRVALFFMDYPNRRRLKLAGEIQQVPESDWQTLANLEDATYRGKVELAFTISVIAFDWNCPQHITPRYTEEEMEQGLVKPK